MNTQRSRSIALLVAGIALTAAVGLTFTLPAFAAPTTLVPDDGVEPQAPATRPIGYVDVGTGDFGSMAWTGFSGMAHFSRYSGAPYALSAQSTSSDPHFGLYGVASSSMLFGDLHAMVDGGSCNRTGTVDPCPTYPTTTFAGAAIWDRITLEGGEPGQTIRPLLHIDGVTLGTGYAMLRSYVGLSNDPVRELNRLPGQGWRYLSGNVDLEIELADMALGFPVGWTVFIELEISAREAPGGNVADFGNTARFEWDLPTGVTYRSASGQFMAGVPASAVPEPGALVLASVGLLALRVRRTVRR